jgi:hypothetical protein
VSADPGGDLAGADLGGRQVAAKSPVGVEDEGAGGVDPLVVERVERSGDSHEREGSGNERAGTAGR